jgi:hypothetical protein
MRNTHLSRLAWIPGLLVITSTTVSSPQVDLRPHTDDIRSDGYFTLKRAARLLSFQPHMHNRGKHAGHVHRLRVLGLATAVILSAASDLAVARQGAAGRRLTTIDALRQFPNYFHLQNVLVNGEFAEDGTRILLRGGDHEIRVLLNDQKTVDGMAEVRGQLVDVGRLEPTDPRVTALGRDAENWPRPGEELIVVATGVSETQLATSPSVRALALQPWRFMDQKVTVVGQFRGRNLFGDLPSAPGKSRYDFVLRSTDAAIWVTGLRPRGKGFDLNVDARVDTGRWLQVTGTIEHERGLVSLAATAMATAAEPPAPPPANDEPAAPPVPLQPGTVVFGSPTDAEVDVPATTTVRVQFSRGLNPATLAGRIRVRYLGGPDLPFQMTYDAGTRSIELKFTQPLERFMTVRVELLEGIRMFDGAPLTPWMTTFAIGG